MRFYGVPGLFFPSVFLCLLLVMTVQDNHVSKTPFKILKPENDVREYEYIRLTNGLEALLISDPECDKAAAALDVHIGSMYDPSETQGLAHFLEHLLFMGTAKYPKEAEYSLFLAEHGGSSNAYTDSEDTNYFFDVAAGYLEPALDRFAQFFVAPLFDPSCTEREREAVDSEHKKNLENDSWRLRRLVKNLASSDHAFHNFGTGDRTTLQGTSDRDIRQVLLSFYGKYYSADIMKLTVYGKEPLPTLMAWVTEKFSAVQSRTIPNPAPQWSSMSPFEKDTFGQIIWARPLKTMKSLTVQWVISDYRPLYRNKAIEYLSHIIGNEGKDSLYSYLKKKGWVVGLSVGLSDNVTGFSLFSVDLKLTSAGLPLYKEIVQCVFSYLKFLKTKGPQKYIFEECQKTANINYEFHDKNSPMETVHTKAHQLQYVRPEDIHHAQYDWSQYDESIISNALHELSLSNFYILFAQLDLPVTYDQHEQYYGTEYHLEKLDPSFLEGLDNYADTSGLFSLPEKNIFIPEDFEIHGRKSEIIEKSPRCVLDSPEYKAWYKLDDQFLLPKAIMSFIIKNPFIGSSPYNYARSVLCKDLLADFLNETLYPAFEAGFSFRFSLNMEEFVVEVSGYNDKLARVLGTIISAMFEFSVERERFDVIYEDVVRKLKNFDRDPPYQHASIFAEHCLTDIYYTPYDLLEAMQAIEFEDLSHMIEEFFGMVSCESLIHGNMTLGEARAVSLRIRDVLFSHGKKLPEASIPRNRKIELPLAANIAFERTIDNVNSAIHVALQLDALSNKKCGALAMLFNQIFSDHFFDILRTKEQLGYIVSHRYKEDLGSYSLVFLIQSARHPYYLLSRIENFFGHVQELLGNLTDQEFSTNVEALSHILTKKFNNLGEEFNSFMDALLKGHYNFERRQQFNSLVLSLTKQDLQDFCHQYIFEKSRRKLFTSLIISQTKTFMGDRPMMQLDDQDDNVALSKDVQLYHYTGLTAWKHAQRLLPLSHKSPL